MSELRAQLRESCPVLWRLLAESSAADIHRLKGNPFPDALAELQTVIERREQAAREEAAAAERERCAEVCEEHASMHHRAWEEDAEPERWRHNDRSYAAHDCAAAIRKGPTP